MLHLPKPITIRNTTEIVRTPFFYSNKNNQKTFFASFGLRVGYEYACLTLQREEEKLKKKDIIDPEKLLLGIN